MKKSLLIAFIITIFICIPISAFANTYELDNGGITVDISPREWEIYTKDNYQEYQETLGEYYDYFDDAFSSGVYEMIVYSKEKPYYWCLGESIRSEFKNFDSLTDQDVVSSFKNQLPIPVSSGDDAGEYTNVYVYHAENYRFIVFEGTATSDGITQSVIQYMAPMNKKVYVLTAYRDGKGGFKTDEKGELERKVIKKMSFSKPSNLYNKNATTEIGGGDFEYWITKLIIPAAIIMLGGFVIKRRKNRSATPTELHETKHEGTMVIEELETSSVIEKKVDVLQNDNYDEAESFKTAESVADEPSDENIYNKANSYSGKIPAESLRALKELYDEGVLTKEEYTSKKKQLLGL